MIKNLKELNNSKDLKAKLSETTVKDIEDAITLDELEIQKEQIQMMPAFITMEKCFNDLPKIEIPNKIKYLNGQLQNVELSDGIYNIYFEGEYIGIGVVKNNILKRDIVI